MIIGRICYSKQTTFPSQTHAKKHAEIQFLCQLLLQSNIICNIQFYKKKTFNDIFTNFYKLYFFLGGRTACS